MLLDCRPGHFIIKGTPLGTVLMDGPVNTSVTQSIKKQFICGTQRTQEQDIEFSVLQLVEVAVRALSPGVNDPFTCIQGIDYLSAILCRLVQRKFPSPYRYDGEKNLRISAPPVTSQGVLNAAFHQIRQHGKGDVAIMIRLLEGLARIGKCVERDKDRDAVRRQVEMLERGSRKTIQEKNDLTEVENRCRLVLALLSLRDHEVFM